MHIVLKNLEHVKVSDALQFGVTIAMSVRLKQTNPETTLAEL